MRAERSHNRQNSMCAVRSYNGRNSVCAVRSYNRQNCVCAVRSYNGKAKHGYCCYGLHGALFDSTTSDLSRHDPTFSFISRHLSYLLGNSRRGRFPSSTTKRIKIFFSSKHADVSFCLFARFVFWLLLLLLVC